MTQLILVGLGLAAGVLSGFLGIGGGILMVPALTLLLKLDIHKAIGTSLMVIVPTACVGVAKHYSMGNVNWKIGVALLIGSVAGGYIGAALTQFVPSAIMKKIFAGFMLVVAGRLMLG